MNKQQDRFAVRASVIGVRAVLVAMAAVSVAQAEEANDAARQLTRPTSTLEAGVGYVSQDSFKFGEYNGLFRQGLFGIFNVDVRGGAPYDSADPTRWSILGTDLGLDDRAISARYAQQGRFRIDVGYDQLRKNVSDSYQTPYLGSGTSDLTLPINWARPLVPQVSATGVNFRALSPVTGLAPSLVSGVVTTPTAAQQAIVSNIIANDVPNFRNLGLDTTRRRYDGGFTYDVDRSWQVKVSARHETKDGLRPLAAVSSQVSENAIVMPLLIDQTTDQYNASLTYNGGKAFGQIAYYGSVFKNNVQSMTWQDVNDPTRTATMSTAPSNDFHQLLLTGGYNFSPATKLVLFGSYARNTQDDSFVTAGQNNQFPLGLPASSLDGLVIWKAFNAKLTSKPVKNLSLVAAYKFDDRDNQTPVNTYVFQDANEARATAASAFNAALGLPANTLGSNINIYANRPYSKKTNQFDLGADYRLAPGHALAAAYQYQQIDRVCDGSWISCADAPKTRENTVKAEWRASVIEDLSTRLAYEYSARRVDYDENAFLALVPMANVVPAGGATVSAYQYLLQTGLTGFGPVAGFPATALTGDAAIFSPNNNILPQALYGSRNNINELYGLRRFNMADRNRHKVRGMVNWEANDRLSVQAGLDYNKDDYENSLYGLTDAQSWAVNLQAGYSLADNLSLTAYYTYEDIKSQTAGRSYGSNSTTANIGGVAGNTVVSGGCYATVLERNMNTKIDPCLNWSTDMRDKVDTFGIGVRHRGLLGGRLDVMGDLVYTYAKTDIGVMGGSYANNPFAVAGLPAVVPAALFIPAADMPTVSSKTFEIRLAGQYAIDRSSSVRLQYWFQRLRSTDYVYDGMQYGTVSAVIPTNEQAFNYNVHVVGLSYLYRWQ